MTAADRERAFLQAVQEDPANDTPRLIYADWLEEQGRPDRAHFIREQCAGRRCKITKGQFRAWFRPWWGRTAFGLRYTTDAGVIGEAKENQTVFVRRGFVQRIVVPHDVFVAGAADLFTAHPIEQVVLSDNDRITVSSSPGGIPRGAIRLPGDVPLDPELETMAPAFLGGPLAGPCFLYGMIKSGRAVHCPKCEGKRTSPILRPIPDDPELRNHWVYACAICDGVGWVRKVWNHPLLRDGGEQT